MLNTFRCRAQKYKHQIRKQEEIRELLIHKTTTLPYSLDLVWEKTFDFCILYSVLLVVQKDYLFTSYTIIIGDTWLHILI